jgi:hypothetical protein
MYFIVIGVLLVIQNDIKCRLVDLAVSYFLENKDKISYDKLHKLFSGIVSVDELTTAAELVAGTTIVHNIPVKNEKTGLMELRPIEACYPGQITFWKSNQQEKFIVNLTHNETLVDLASSRTLPRLNFLNTNHEFLEAGTGEGIPDLVDIETGITYEVKSNYRRRGSVSSLHDANRLLDCDGTHLVCYSVYNNVPDFRAAMLRFPNKLPEFKYSHAINDELLSVVKSGELIPEVESRLAEKDFKWKP